VNTHGLAETGLCQLFCVQAKSAAQYLVPGVRPQIVAETAWKFQSLSPLLTAAVVCQGEVPHHPLHHHELSRP
jgi:hypothetical protein